MTSSRGFLGFAFLFLAGLLPARAAENLVVTGDSWRYQQDGAAPAAEWIQANFDDSDWPAGPSPLGYGESWLATPLNLAPFTAYFRHGFQISAVPADPVLLRVMRDDGVIVYLNGSEVFRNNMPGGPVDADTPALTAASEPHQFFEHWVAPSFFTAGSNVLAAEVHQASLLSSDLVFDLQLQDTNGPPDPGVAITSPANNATVRAGTDVLINAIAEPLAEVLWVEFYVDQFLWDLDFDAPYGIVLYQIPEGTYVAQVVAYLLDGSSITSAPVRFTAAPDLPLTVSITRPTEGAMFPPGTIILEAAASASPGRTITMVEFFADGLGIGEAFTAPYTMDWTDVIEGDYAISARAWDDQGTSAVSTPVSIQVRGSGTTLLRGPYLQTGTPTSVIIKWRTSSPTDSLVRFGLTAGNLNQNAQITSPITEHEVPVSGLSPDTKYFYSIGSSVTTLSSGPDHFFITAPASPKPTRIWVIGDSGTGGFGQTQVRDAYAAYTGTRYTDAWLMLGDNAYGSGTDSEYQFGMFDVYGAILRQTVVWPTIGNHDASPAYFDIFSLPRNGEAGGVPSGVENYYSYDYGNIHFICLGGYYSGSRLSNGPMCTWLKADLEANTNQWLIAYWHQPPYTKGSHDSDAEGDLIEMRRNAVPILESYGVDLVLCGHSHNYERSYLLHGHYGFSWQLEPEMLLDNGSGRVDDAGPYLKQTTGANHGTVYIVAGSSGWISGCCRGLNHPAMYSSLGRMGSLVLDIDGDTLQGTFLRETGEIDDYFTIVKDSTVVQIVQVSHAAGTTILRWTSTPLKHYQVEHTSTLAGSWTPLGNQIQANSALTQTSHSTAGAPQIFYRVVQTD